MRIVAPLCLYLAVVAATITTATIVSCSSTDCKDPKNAMSAACVVEVAAIDCAGSDVAGVITQYTPTVEDIIKKGLNPDGSINYAAIESDLVMAIAKYGWCVVAAVFDHYIHPNTAALGAARVPTPAAAQDTFDKLRAKVAPKLKVHTVGGDL